MTDVVPETAGHLEKAKAALAAAREVTLEIHQLADDEDKSRTRKTRTQIELLDIAKVQALTSIAESLERIAGQEQPIRPDAGRKGNSHE